VLLPGLLPWQGRVLQALQPLGLAQLLEQALLPWPVQELLPELLPELRVLPPVLLPGPPERAQVLRTAEQTQCW